MSSAVVNDGLLFGFSHYNKGQLFCIDVDSGDILWKGPGRSGQNATFLAVPRFVLVLFDDGQLQAVPVDRQQYRSVASWAVSDRPTWAPPVLLQNTLLIKDRTHLVAWAVQ
jgi:outer membrane protein assembly factor BamB